MKPEIANNLKHHFENKEGVCSYCIKLGIYQEQKRIIEMFRSLYEKKKIALKNLGLPLEDWWGESEIFSVNELEDLKHQIDSQETRLDERATGYALKSNSNKRDGSLNQSPDTQIQEEKK